MGDSEVMLIVGLIVTAWFALSFPVAVVVGRMLAAGHAPEPHGGVLVRLERPSRPTSLQPSGPRTAS